MYKSLNETMVLTLIQQGTQQKLKTPIAHFAHSDFATAP